MGNDKETEMRRILVLAAFLASVATGLSARAGDGQAQATLSAAQEECLALAIYFEARGEPKRAQQAVAAVVLNRVEDPEFPDTVCGVVRQGGENPPCQFSWWCDGLSDTPAERDAWNRARALAAEMTRTPIDPTDGALYFHHVQVRPKWRHAFQQTAEIGDHLYYR